MLPEVFERKTPMRYLWAIVLGLAFASNARAQYDSPWQFYINGSAVSPRDPAEFEDGFKNGWGLGLAAGRRAYPLLTVQGALEWNRFGLDQEVFLASQSASPDSVAIEGGDGQIVTGTLNFKVDPFVEDKTFTPYVVAGFGVFITSIDDLRATGTSARTFVLPLESQTSFGVNGGIGLDLRLSPWQALFLEGKYVLGFPPGDDIGYVVVKFGLLLN